VEVKESTWKRGSMNMDFFYRLVMHSGIGPASLLSLAVSQSIIGYENVRSFRELQPQ
jgi:hypothetical protein